jgi:hypothetical protein
MPWFKVDDGFAFHPKAIMAGNAALGLWVRAGAWCGANLTDGALPRHMIGTFGAQARDAKKLCTVGLWVEIEDGYQFHDWHLMQPTKADVEAERAANRARQKEWREKKRNSVTDTVTNAASNAAPSRPVPTRPYKEEAKASSSAAKRGSRISDDFQITDAMKEWAAAKAPNADLGTETEKFVNYWVAKSGKDATKLDWVATWRNWILNARSTQPARMDHSARGLAKGMAMLQAYDAHQDTFLEIEG